MSGTVTGESWNLPWGVEEDEEKRLLISQIAVLAPTLLLAITLPLLPLIQMPEKEKQISEPPERLARLLVKKTPPLPAPPPPESRAEVAAPKPDPAPEVARSQAAPRPAPRRKPAPVSARPSAQERAEDALRGVDQVLSSFKRQDVATLIETDTRLSGATGAADDNAGAVIAADATRGSGGIGDDHVIAPSGNTRLAGRQTTAVQGESAGTSAGGNTNRRGSYAPSRSSESIQLVIDRNKNAFDRLYARTLRSTPDISGTVILRFSIAPGGKVTRCEILRSELNNPELERKLIARFKLLDFGAQQVPAITVEKPLTFYPR